MIKVKLFANLREGKGKEINIEFSENLTGRKLLRILNIPENRVSIFLVNGKDKALDETLSDGDIVAIFPPIGGG